MTEKVKHIEYPENWADMVAKYEEATKKATQAVLEKRGAKAESELLEVTAQVLKQQAAKRGPEEYQPLTDEQRAQILHKPKDPKIIALREQLNEEIKNVAQAKLGKTAAPQNEDLKGRVSKGPASSDKGHS